MGKISIACPVCKQTFSRTQKQITVVVKRSGAWCCKSCSSSKSNKSRSFPLGSVRINKKGYVLEKTSRGWELQHRAVVEKHIGSPLKPTELVHHIDGNKENNSIENLEIESWSSHTVMHHLGKSRQGNALENIKKSFEKRCTAKLSYNKAAEIKSRVAAGETVTSIAKSLHVSPMTISRASRGESWKNDLS